MKIGMKKTAAILAGVLTVTALAGCGQKKSEKAADLNFGDTYPGGAAKAIEDGVIIETTDYLDKYAPNLKSYLENHPNIDKIVKTDVGQYYSFPAIQGDDFLLTYTGLILRKDWLDELGLDVPETIDEWETVLTAFKEKKGAAAPITYEDSLFKNSSSFLGAYGIAV